MNVAELIALLETIKDKSLEVKAEGHDGFFSDLPVDPVLDIYGGYVYIQEGE